MSPRGRYVVAGLGALALLLLAAGCADILGLDPLGPAVRDGSDEQDLPPDAGADASADTSDQ